MSRRLRTESGFTLMEVLIASSLMLVVLGATLTVFEQFVQVGNRNTQQNDAQDKARFAIDAVTRQLRNLALPTPASPNSIDQAGSYDLVFKTADPGRRRVRYCLQTTAPYSTSNGVLWLQTQTGLAGAADPPSPSTSSCPAPLTSGGWSAQTVVASNVTNRNNADRPIFQYNAPTSTTSKITEIHVALFVDSDPIRSPAESKISSGVFLRNQNQAPVGAFSWTPGGSRRFLFNAAGVTDPEGRTLSYFWFLGTAPSYANALSSGTCASADGCLGTGVVLDYTVPTSATGTQTFTLLAVDPGGLTHTVSTNCNPSTGTCTTPS
jgi:prepilin-type N-terminal cleavage/methylation domain-containing protein